MNFRIEVTHSCFDIGQLPINIDKYLNVSIEINFL